GGRGEWGSERDGHRIRHANGPLPEESTAFEAEDASPDAVKIDGHDRYIQAVHNPLEPAFERKHVPGAADRAFGKDADDVTVLQFAPCLFERSESLTAGRDRDGSHQLQQRMEGPVLVV